MEASFDRQVLPDDRTPGKGSDSYTWRPLHYLNLYRLTLSGFFVVLEVMDTGPRLLGEHDSRLFFYVSLAYLAAGFLNTATILWRKPAFHIQVYTHILTDFVAITLLMHASGGVSSGLGMLMVAAIAGGSILMAGRTAMSFAAIASLFILLEEIYAQFGNIFSTTHYTQAGLLGATFFATAILARVLALRIRESEELAAKRGSDLAIMEQLAEYVIQRMQTGIMILDSHFSVRLANESARHLLGLAYAAERAGDLPEDLTAQLREWQKNTDYEPQVFRAPRTGAEVLPRFASLGWGRSDETLIFVEDIAATAQQAQQLKLASLGRLTASIAHEIRNPLGAISHAGQLLAESPKLEAADIRLTEIIREQSQRMNSIIENILRLSRRGQAHPQEFDLKSWLQGFVDEFSRSRPIDPRSISLNIRPSGVGVRIDPSQLHQILWNLCDNAIKHSDREGKTPRLELRGGILADSNNPYLEVIDNGPGIPPDVAEHIFEPFFTTRQKGTGLGLYIARELCEANQARLSHTAAEGGGSCFRITFVDPRRKQVA